MEQNFSLAQKIFQTLLIVVGMLLNATVLFVVSLSRQLRYPRHVFWAAVSFFECVFLVQSILEMVVILNRSDLACPPYVILASVDYSVLLLCLSLAALDRYLAIARYEWYKKKVTNRGVIVLISVTSTQTFVIITAPSTIDRGGSLCVMFHNNSVLSPTQTSLQVKENGRPINELSKWETQS